MGKERSQSDIGAPDVSGQRLLKGSKQMRGNGQEACTPALASLGLDLPARPLW